MILLFQQHFVCTNNKLEFWRNYEKIYCGINDASYFFCLLCEGNGKDAAYS